MTAVDREAVGGDGVGGAGGVGECGPSDAFKRRVDADLAPIRNLMAELRAQADALSASLAEPPSVEWNDIAPKFGAERDPLWGAFDNDDTYDERDEVCGKHHLPGGCVDIKRWPLGHEQRPVDHEHRTGILRRLFRRAVAACEQL